MAKKTIYDDNIKRCTMNWLDLLETRAKMNNYTLL